MRKPRFSVLPMGELPRDTQRSGELSAVNKNILLVKTHLWSSCTNVFFGKNDHLLHRADSAPPFLNWGRKYGLGTVDVDVVNQPR